MFVNANAFNQDISGWNLGNVMLSSSPFGAGHPISNANKPARFRSRGGGAKQTRRARRRASRKRSQKGKRSRKGRRTLKRGSKRTRRR
jgi:hypothetical protein